MNTLKTRIMNRVYAIYALRQLSQPAVKVGALAALLFALRELTFVSKVVENASLKHDALGFVNYMFYAFTNTEFVVQLVVVAVLALALFMAKDTLTLIRPRFV
jgi:hypothetical protein